MRISNYQPPNSITKSKILEATTESITMEQYQQQRKRRKTTTSIMFTKRQFLFCTIILSLIVLLIVPTFNQAVEAKKIKAKEKKVLKQLVQGLMFKNLSTRKNFLPLPVPIPVPIELSEPPVYIKGKPKYVTIYGPPPPIAKPTTVYHMPVYLPRYEYITMTDSSGLYVAPVYGVSTGSGYAKYTGKQSSYPGSNQKAKFNDFDDDFGSYYLSKSASSNDNQHYYTTVDAGNQIHQRVDFSTGRSAVDSEEASLGAYLMPTEEKESLDEEERPSKRVKRQAYESSYENEPPCYGFPLEINIKSRIKMDQIFPIHGKSQIKKCIKVGRPLLPPVEDYPPSY